jgi:parallel beta-helix repeat protein
MDKISNNTCSKNEYGIYLFIFSINNSITKNLFSDLFFGRDGNL